MIGEAQDFLDESVELAALLDGLNNASFETATQFKGWTINDVLQHLHVWNSAAALSVCDEAALCAMIGDMRAAENLRAFERRWTGDARGRTLFSLWRRGVEQTAETFRGLDPKRRLNWIGPPMSARSSITARQMETWAHGQAVYDLLGVERRDADRLRNVAHLGVTTFAWSYTVRGLAAPERAPHVVLTAPSGQLWRWNEPSEIERVEGEAVEFCQVITQTRNIADTALRVSGPVANEWMSIAQCFAGRASEPPAPGTRFRRRE